MGGNELLVLQLDLKITLDNDLENRAKEKQKQQQQQTATKQRGYHPMNKIHPNQSRWRTAEEKKSEYNTGAIQSNAKTR